MTPARLTALLAVVGLLLAANGQGASSKLPKWAKPLLKMESRRGNHIHEDDDWLVLHAELTIGVDDEGRTVEVYRRVFENLGEEKASLHLGISFNEALQTLSNVGVWGRQYGRLWRKANLQRASLETPNFSSDLVTTGRVRFVQSPAVRPGERVVATWKVTNTEMFPGEWLIRPQETMPINQFLVRAEEDANLYWVLVEPGGETRQLDHRGFELSDLPALNRTYSPEDPWSASPLMSTPFAFVSRHAANEQSWRLAAVRVHRLFQDSLALDLAAAEAAPHILKARELTASLDSTEQKIAALARFVQALPYRNVAWGDGAFRPEPPSESLRTLSGDCKAKTLLLSAMLDEIGVSSVPVLARLDEQYLEYETPASVNIFNHVVLAVDAPGAFGGGARLNSGAGAGWILFDPTDSLATFGVPPSHLQGTLGLWLGEEGAAFKINFPEGNDQVSAGLDFKLETPAAARFRLTVTGASAFAQAAQTNSDAQGLLPRIRRHTEQTLRRKLPNLQVEEVLFEPPDHLRAQAAKVTIIGVLPEPVRRLSADLISLEAPTLLVGHALGLPRHGYLREEREALNAHQQRWEVPLCCSAGEQRLDATINLSLPEHWTIERKPQLQRLEKPWLVGGFNGDGDFWRMGIKTLRGDFSGNSVAERMADMNLVATALRQSFIIRINNSG